MINSRNTVYAVVFLVSVSACCVQSVHAKDHFDFIQVSCIPEFDYFALHTIVMSPGRIGETMLEEQEVQTDVLQRLKSQNHLFPVKQLINHSYECNLTARTITVKVSSVNEQRENVERARDETFGIEVLAGVKIVASFSAFGQNNMDNHWLELNHDFLQDCTFTDYDDRKTCLNRQLMPMIIDK